jgi:hypothetical protein
VATKVGIGTAGRSPLGARAAWWLLAVLICRGL